MRPARKFIGIFMCAVFAIDCEQSLFCATIRRTNQKIAGGMFEWRAASSAGSRLLIFAWYGLVPAVLSACRLCARSTNFRANIAHGLFSHRHIIVPINDHLSCEGCFTETTETLLF